jgi:hypothetical protein
MTVGYGCLRLVCWFGWLRLVGLVGKLAGLLVGVLAGLLVGFLVGRSVGRSATVG